MDDERVGNEQRAQVVGLLGAAVEQGYLTLDEYDERTVAATQAKTRSVLQAQVADLPAQFRWGTRAPGQQPVPGRGSGHPADDNAATCAVASLVLGVVSIPLSLCLVGWLFGLGAVVLSVPGARSAGTWNRAVVGRVLGSIGILLSALLVVLVTAAGWAGHGGPPGEGPWR
ncbi:DUF1707 domain-containing protein [Planosporangium thailandense]|uniref:DUF1707 domain-containing protein n=1 Tax=Planosporangium thailandense TaxID=765197 RepID=A0ABX0XZX8_9ACTN|nr:DUF1707 domain-containing protein [Planosporangium thailandense]NJC71646.1 DUF1707 domain-containing protein [Planosporangium thailandense]